MNRPSASKQIIVSDEQQSEVGTRLHGRILVLVRGTSIVGVVAILAVFFASIPPYFAKLQTICAISTCQNGQLTLNDVRWLHELGLSLTFYASYKVATTVVFMLVWSGVAALLLWRKSDDLMALFTVFTLVTFGSIQGDSLYALPAALAWLVPLMRFLGSLCFGLFFYLFPTGRFVARWVRWLAIGSIVFWGTNSFIPYSTDSFFFWLMFFLFVGFLASIVVVQVYRYRRVSGPAQRQQTKWVVFGASLAAGGYLGVVVLGFLFPSLQQGLIGNMLLGTAFSFFLLLIPLSIGFAISHSNLWEIDVIINRTLVYGTLTASLALVYVGLVIGLQALLRGIISQDSSVAIVISTLAIAALFQPLRRRIQRLIDRRFYRSKYDAKRIIEAFSATLRAETDLTRLSEQLVAVVEETIQPTHVSLWLRPPAQDEKRKPWRARPPGSSEGR